MTTRFTAAKGSPGERILSTATSLFARFGYHGVSTRNIAVAAGVNEVTIYRQYQRKRDLYLAVLDSALSQVRLQGDLLTQIAEAENVQVVLSRTFALIAITLNRQPELLGLLHFGVLEFNDDLDPLFRRHLGELVKVLACYIEPWIRRGELRCPSAKTLILTLVAIVLSHYPLNRIFPGDGSGSVPILESYAEVLWGMHGSGK